MSSLFQHFQKAPKEIRPIQKFILSLQLFLFPYEQNREVPRAIRECFHCVGETSAESLGDHHQKRTGGSMRGRRRQTMKRKTGRCLGPNIPLNCLTFRLPFALYKMHKHPSMHIKDNLIMATE